MLQSAASVSAPSRPAAFWLELGLTCAAMGDHDGAADAKRRAAALKPELTDATMREGRPSEARPRPGRIDKAEQKIQALIAGAAPPLAAELLRAHLKDDPTDAAALRHLAQLALPAGQFAAMQRLLERAVELAPSYLAARQNLGFVLLAQNKARQAMPHIDMLLAREPRDNRNRLLRARAFTSLGDYDRAIELFGAILRDKGAGPGARLGYADALKYAGRGEESVRAYRECLALAPAMGAAWWGLANLKADVFSAADRNAMRAHLAAPALAKSDRIPLHYALGSALEHAGEYAESFAHYAAGAALKRTESGHDAQAWRQQIRRIAAAFLPTVLAGGEARGCPDPAPIFIVGLPRAGSTLVEQILASHSEVEGTRELPLIPDLVQEWMAAGEQYPACVATASPAELAALGARYIERSRAYRKTNRTRFIDKLPANWMHAGLIHLILPNAKIIDARREPMANCFSAFKQYFPNGAGFSYDLADLGRHYRDYDGLMAHFDTVMPGRIHRVQYENLVENTEAEIAALLDHCGLAFEPACLRFWENRRTVGTASAAQVRQPIFRSALEQWRNYEPWLGKLKEELLF